MYRKELIEYLQHHKSSISELARQFEAKPADIIEEMEHIRKTLRHEGLRMRITPASCRKCHFVFNRDKLDKPGKCPKCKSTWIQEPEFLLEKA